MDRFRAFAARRDVAVQVKVAERLVAAARQAIPLPEAVVARRVIEADLELLTDLDAQVADADARIGALIPATRYTVLSSGPGWGEVRVGGYAAALRERGKPGGVIATALARRANKIAFAMVRDQTLYDPAVWQRQEG